MSLRTVEVAHVLISLVLLVIVAHCGAYAFKVVRQPPVIGEIVGGLLLGPTVLGTIAPDAQEWLIPKDGPSAHALGVFYHLGLLLLVYLTGAELRGRATGPERRTIAAVAVSGLVLPFGAGLAIGHAFTLGGLSGDNGSRGTLVLIFGMAIAVTSVPVISRIMLDLGILGTAFSRVVLAVAVLEDVVLYVILAVVLGIAQAQSGDTYGIGGMIGEESLPWAVVYFSVAPLVFLVLLLWRGKRVFTVSASARWNVLARRSPIAFLLVFLFGLCLACMSLGIDPMFGALTAGMCGAGVRRTAASRETLQNVSLAFFIPVYFAVVGLKLDLVRHFDPLFFLWFLTLACAVKFSSVWLGARLAGQSAPAAGNLAVAMNARGGPGIILASVTFGAGIISEEFFTSLVVLSIVTSQIAGVWLGRTVALERPLLSPSLEAPPHDGSDGSHGGDGPDRGAEPDAPEGRGRAGDPDDAADSAARGTTA
ncbi:cation:proton antiporter [Streptomyces sp. SAJ15]|uniref:cation:proton antiporter n=1 Tax=Streptomyces sp. SAJ15 TaxID=2011095 RepID=UPI001186DBE3|nr:cation:proton antiporter [Streptomyces sp. SAJ15]TVL91414.1 sodium:proton exchanger [Streptomyces sp. SAJ15]